MLTFPHRKFNKAIWKYLYRRFRIIMRETTKINTELVLFGTAFSDTDNEGLIRHIPANQVIIFKDEQDNISIKLKA